jgi:hypothetical protein
MAAADRVAQQTAGDAADDRTTDVLSLRILRRRRYPLHLHMAFLLRQADLLDTRHHPRHAGIVLKHHRRRTGRRRLRNIGRRRRAVVLAIAVVVTILLRMGADGEAGKGAGKQQRNQGNSGIHFLFLEETVWDNEVSSYS